MGQIIAISPVTRIEGHAAITIRLDDAGQVAEARLQVREFRGFESFCIGRPFWEMPAITSRICGICPVSHALAAARAGERILEIEPPPAAILLRTVLSLAQIVLSHSLSFFHLSAPDIVLGLDADPAERNIVGLARHHPELIRKGVRLRQIGQELVSRIGGGNLHPEHICAGGMRQPLGENDRDALAALLPEAQVLVDYAHAVWEEHGDRFRAEMGEWEEPACLSLGLVSDDGCQDYLGGSLRFVDGHGTVVVDVPGYEYGSLIRETPVDGSYMKTTDALAGSTPFYRVGPLARLQVAPFRDAPRAEMARQKMILTVTGSCGYHQARVIEMQYAVERMLLLFDNPLLCDRHVLNHGQIAGEEGVDVVEAPRGTLIHHYHVDRHGLLTKVNLIVATGHNSRAMDRTITAIARRHLSGARLTEGLLNRVEHGIRLYDPCLSCATHTHGRLGMGVTLHAPNGAILDRATI